MFVGRIQQYNHIHAKSFDVYTRSVYQLVLTQFHFEFCSCVFIFAAVVEF